MKRLSIIMIVMLMTLGVVGYAQENQKVEVYTKVHINKKRPVPYPSIREADVLWTKTIWRMIDLRQKINLPLYYPTKPIGDRMSLISLLLYGIQNEGLNVYDPEASEAKTEFDILMTPEQVMLAMDALDDTIDVQDENGFLKKEIVKGEPKVLEVKQVMLKEVWYFDKQHSVMRVQIVGICPIRVFKKDENSPQMVKKRTFWVYYPDVRPLFANHEMYNRHNDAQRISFDDFFMQRRFNGYIWAESNVYNDRFINEYAIGLHSLQESNRIEEEIFRMEHDMWVY